MRIARYAARLRLFAGLILTATFPANAADGLMLYQNGANSLKFGGRVQAQYHKSDLDPGADTEDVFFRRVTPNLEATLGKDWFARLQIELVSSTNGRRVTQYKDVYAQYKGLSGMKLNIGNAAFPYSREFLTSAERQQFVERTLTGSRSYGVPYRNFGLHLTGECDDTRITYGFSLSHATIHPDNTKITFDTPLNKGDDMNNGWMAGGRMDYHPYGKLAFSQGDFDRKTRATVGIAAYNWRNSGNNTYTNGVGGSTNAKKNDVDQVQGAEVSGALRYQGWSADAEYNRIKADAVVSGFTGTNAGNLYKNGRAELRSYMVKGGYMVIDNKLELVAGYQGLDADTYQKTWTTALIGANWYFNKHDLKLQTTFQHGDDVKGSTGTRQDELFAQVQYVF
jgi:hypothetical protein